MSSAFLELALWYACFGLMFLFPSSPVRTLLPANTSLLLSTHLASQNQFPGKLWLLSVRRGFSRLRASPPCLGATPHTPALLIPVLYRQINYPHSSLVCTNFLPWFSAFNELSKTKIPRLIGQECVHLLDGKFSVSAVVEARTPPASRVQE